MFQGIRFLMHLVPAVIQHLDQEGLQEAVATDHRNGRAYPGGGEPHLPIRFVLHQAGINQPAQGTGNSGQLHPRPFGHRRRLDRTLVPLLQVPDDLQVVLGIGRKLRDIHVAQFIAWRFTPSWFPRQDASTPAHPGRQRWTTEMLAGSQVNLPGDMEMSAWHR